MYNSPDRSVFRSHEYQWKLQEIPWADEFLSRYSVSDSTSGTIQQPNSEALFEIEDKIKQRFWELAKQRLTIAQYRVIELIAKGLTQVEITHILKINQSSVQKSLAGNLLGHGGSLKKLRRIVKADPEMQQLLTAKLELLEE